MEPLGDIIQRTDLLDLPLSPVAAETLDPITMGDLLYDADEREARSYASGITFDPSTDRARQEFKDEADVNVLLSRFGVETPVRVPVYGDVDYDLDLQGAYAAVEQVREAYRDLPASLRERYPTPASLVEAVSLGQLVLDMSRGEPKLDPVPPVPPEVKS